MAAAARAKSWRCESPVTRMAQSASMFKLDPERLSFHVRSIWLSSFELPSFELPVSSCGSARDPTGSLHVAAHLG